MRLHPVRLHLVRHGRASAGWDSALDPGLDELGVEQSRVVAAQLSPLGIRKIITSPLLRCQQTSLPLCEAWSTMAEINSSVSEIPSPLGAAMGERTVWLRAAMSGTWAALGLESVVTWTLTPTASGTRLRMEQAGFRADQEQAFRGATVGWQRFFGGLEAVLARVD